MTESTGVKAEMHFHNGFLAIFGTIKQQGVKSFRGILSLDSYQGPVLDPLGGLTASPRPQLRVRMTFGHSVSYLRHLLLQRELLQKRRELPGTLTNFKGVTVTISPLSWAPFYCIPPERFKTRAAHFPISGNFGQERL